LPLRGSISTINDDHRYSIRQSIGFFYDLQKLRIAATNNIISWCKEHRDALPPLDEEKE
jgi:hypothetical protein